MPNIEKTSANKEENQQRIAAHYEGVHDLFTNAQSTYLERGGNPVMLEKHLKDAFDKSFNILKIKAYLAYREAIEVREIRAAVEARKAREVIEAIEHENDDDYIQEKELNIEELDKWMKINCSKPKNDLIDPTNPVHIIRRDNSGMPFLVRKPFCDNLERYLQFRIIVNQWIAQYEHDKSVTLDDFKNELLRLVEIHDYKYKISKKESDRSIRFHKPLTSANNNQKKSLSE